MGRIIIEKIRYHDFSISPATGVLFGDLKENIRAHVGALQEQKFWFIRVICLIEWMYQVQKKSSVT